jgi:tetratricopeptide (TPR) repeat protein
LYNKNRILQEYEFIYKILVTSKARKIHAKAEESREFDKDFLASLNYADEAVIEYQKDNDLFGFSEIQSTRTITFKHLYLKTNFKGYLILALHSAQAAVDIAVSSNDPTTKALPYFNLGEVLELSNKYKKAVNYYRKAVECVANNPPKRHNNPAVLLNFKNHLYTCMYLAGDNSSLEKAEKTISDLIKTEESSKFHKDVWLSGGYMRIANMLKKDNPDKAKDCLIKAKKIIDNNSNLKLRLGQWNKLSKKVENR